MAAAENRLRRLVTPVVRLGRATGLTRDVLALLPRRPRLALAIARVRDPDPAALPMIDAALGVLRHPGLLRRRARILRVMGQLTEERAVQEELARLGDAAALARIVILDGRLRETDLAWLPTVPGLPTRLEPVHRRRILHIAKNAAPERWSGFTIRTLQNLLAQRDADLDPVVVTEIGWPRIAGATEVAPFVVFEGIDHYRLDRGPSYDVDRLPNDVRLEDTAAAMAAVVERVRPAILHAHSGYRGGDQALIALALREHFGIPVVYEVRGLFEAVWSNDPELAERSEVYARRLAQETRILHEVDGVIAISEVLADELASRGIARERITVVPNGIDPDALRSQSRDPGLRRSLGLEGRFVVGYLGNLDHWREGIDVLISALAELRARGRRNVALLVVGDGSRRAEIEAHANRLGVKDACRFTGRVPREAVGGYYAQMDLFANPRVDERAARLITPLKPFEAMALGIPVLVSDLPALREIVDPPHRGAVAPPGDVAGLATVIASLMDDPERRARLATAGRDWVRAERTWASNGPRYRAAYEAVIGPIV